MNQENVLEIVDRIFTQFAIHYGSNPFDYLYESDVQFAIAALLKDAFTDRLHCETDSDHPLFEGLPDVKRLDLGRVKTEYGYKRKWDIAVLDDRCSVIENPWQIDAAIAIEIKVDIDNNLQIFQRAKLWHDVDVNLRPYLAARDTNVVSPRIVCAGIAMGFLPRQEGAEKRISKFATEHSLVSAVRLMEGQVNVVIIGPDPIGMRRFIAKD